MHGVKALSLRACSARWKSSAAIYNAGKKYDWEFSIRFNYGSAFPFTQTQAFVERMDFSNGLSTDVLTQNGQMDIIYANQINGGRLSAYHRLDLSMKKKFKKTKKLSSLLKEKKNESLSNMLNSYRK